MAIGLQGELIKRGDRIEQLEQQLAEAGQWVPVPRGFEYLTSLPAGDDGVERYFTISVPDPTSMLNDFWLSVVDYYGRASIPLPENLRLCEWTKQDNDQR